jgi:hypothetical protein
MWHPFWGCSRCVIVKYIVQHIHICVSRTRWNTIGSFHWWFNPLHHPNLKDECNYRSIAVCQDLGWTQLKLRLFSLLNEECAKCPTCWSSSNLDQYWIKRWHLPCMLSIFQIRFRRWSGFSIINRKSNLSMPQKNLLLPVKPGVLFVS